MNEPVYVIEISKDIHKKLSDIKKQTGKTKRFIVKEVFEFYFNKCK